MGTALLIVIVCVGMLISFVEGAKVGQSVANGKEVQMPIPHPIEALREREERREAKAEADRMATILSNIENYDGTSAGQQEVPRG